jgi:DNA polymerase-3 subunit gamma/tau
MLVARRADGALRDALSVFDQAVSLCGKNLTIAALSEALGVVGEDLFFELTDHAASGSGAGMLELVQRVVASGFDLQEFLDGVAEHLRNLLVAVTMPDTDLIEASQATRERYAAVAKNFEEARLLRLLSVVDDAMERVKNSRQPRLRLELALLKIAAMPATLDIRRVLGMLDGSEPLPAVQLERAAGTPAPAPVQAAAPAEAAKSVPVAVTPSPAAAVPAAAAAQTSPPPAKPPNPIPAAPEPEEQDELALWERAHESETAAPPPPPEPTLPFDNLPPASAPATGRESRDAFGQPALYDTPKPRKDDSHASAGDSDVAVAELVEADAPEFWQTFVSRVMDEKIHVGALLRHARAATRPDGVLEIRVPDSLSNRMLREHEALLLQVARELGGDHWTAVTLSVDAAGAQPDPNAPREHDPEASLRALCEEYPALRVLMERFGGEIVW